MTSRNACINLALIACLVVSGLGCDTIAFSPGYKIRRFENRTPPALGKLVVKQDGHNLVVTDSDITICFAGMTVFVTGGPPAKFTSMWGRFKIQNGTAHELIIDPPRVVCIPKKTRPRRAKRGENGEPRQISLPIMEDSLKEMSQTEPYVIPAHESRRISTDPVVLPFAVRQGYLDLTLQDTETGESLRYRFFIKDIDGA